MGAASKRRKRSSDVVHADERGLDVGVGVGSGGGSGGGIEQQRHVKLDANEAVVVAGRGGLVVLHGTVKVHGRVLRGNRDGSVRVPLACDGAFPVCVQSLGGSMERDGEETEEGQQGIPYAAARYAEVLLEGSLESLSERGMSYEGFFPVEWVDVADDITARFGLEEHRGEKVKSERNERKKYGGVDIVVVCGSKNTGKSSFCRYLVNSLLNAHDSVLYMDTDCGQPEYTPPGLVSLFEVREAMLEPTYMTRYRRPVASYFIGDTSPGSDPELYERSVGALLERSRGLEPVGGRNTDSDSPGDGHVCGRRRRQRQRRVMVVNTHGWVQGLGLDVLCRFLRRIMNWNENKNGKGDGNQGVVGGQRRGRSEGRVAMVRMQADNPRHNLPDGLFFLEDGGELVMSPPLDYHLPAISSGHESCVAAKELREGLRFGSAVTSTKTTKTMKTTKTTKNSNAAEKRTLQWYNFARHCCDTFGSGNTGGSGGVSIAARLSGQRPYRVGLDAVTLSFFEGFDPEDEERALQILNGSIVGLCGGGHGKDGGGNSGRDGGGNSGRDSGRDGGRDGGREGILPSTAPKECYGVGIVRSVCPVTRSLYVLTPLPLEALVAHVDHLTVGRVCDLPNGLLVGSPYLATGCIVGSGSGSGVRAARGNLERQREQKYVGGR